MKSIVFDLDDTLGDLCTPLMDAMNKATGKTITKEEKDTYSLAMYGVTDQEFYDIMVQANVLEGMIPFASTKFVLNALKKHYRIHIVTARAWHPDGLQVTRDWFKKHNLPYEDIRLSDPHHSKIDRISDLSEIALAVDDRDTHCKDFDDHHTVEKVLMMNQPWNKYTPHSIQRIHDIREVLEYI